MAAWFDLNTTALNNTPGHDTSAKAPPPYCALFPINVAASKWIYYSHSVIDKAPPCNAVLSIN